MITGRQIRMARAALRWTAQELAAQSGVSWATIQRVEATDSVPSALGKTLDAIQRAFQAAGVQFIDSDNGGPGVRLKKPTIRLISRRANPEGLAIKFRVAYRGQEIECTLGRRILDTWDRAHYSDRAKLESAFDNHASAIFEHARGAIDAGRVRDGFLTLEPDDFPEIKSESDGGTRPAYP